MRKAHNFVDLTGQRFNRLIVLERAGSKNGKTVWLCKCDCGNECTATTNGLHTGNNQSCGCLHAEKFTHKTHGKRNTRLYRIYDHMIDRCGNPNNKDYAKYGGRGIAVCDEWRDFETFFKWAMANGYCDTLTIDRTDNDKGYSPDNCRWVTMTAQGNNKSNNITITFNSETRTLKQWSEALGISYSALYQRICVRGWTIERAFTTK